jgi:succinate dehydrogenase cytochrome b556 subunit
VYRTSHEQRIRAYAELWPAHPRWGVWAWRLQRYSGLALVAYAVWHIVTVTAAARQPERFGPLLVILHHPTVFGALMVGLAYHAANGVRLVLFDAGIDAMRRRGAFWGALAVAAAIVTASLGRVLSR